MKGVRKAVLTGAFALTAAAGAQAQPGAGSDLLRQIGRAIQGSPKVVGDRTRSPYLEPAGTYWDLDQDGLEGIQHLRAGVTAVGGGAWTPATCSCSPWPIRPIASTPTNANGA